MTINVPTQRPPPDHGPRGAELSFGLPIVAAVRRGALA